MKPVAHALLVVAALSLFDGSAACVGQAAGSGLGAPRTNQEPWPPPGVHRAGRDGVTSPKVISEVRPAYTSEAMRARIRGDVLLECVVTVDGTVSEVKVVRSLDATYGMDASAVEAVKQWRFSPATKGGTAVPAVVSVSLSFSLDVGDPLPPPEALRALGERRAITAQPRPNFSGTWVFDRTKSMQPGPDGRIVLAPMLGDEFDAHQDAKALTLTIRTGALTVNAVYALDGSESRNVSPGTRGEPDITVLSRASWDGNRLVILTTSTSTEKGQEVTVETKRVISLDDESNLIIERTGTPPTLVKPSRSVYRKRR
jgi:protein TonB